MVRKNEKGSFRTRSNGRIEYRFRYVDEFGRTKVKSISGSNEKDCVKRADDWIRNYKESVKKFDQNATIPDHWLAIDERRLWCCEYELDLEAFNTKWSNVDSSIDVIMEKPSIEVFVGEKMLMNPGHNQEPTIITFKDPCDKTVEVVVHGLRVEVLPGWPDEEGEEAGLFIEYEAPANLQMNFYRTDYLDASQSDNESGIFAMACDDQNSNVRYDYIGLAPNVFDEFIEVELFSYYILEQEELPMKADVAKR